MVVIYFELFLTMYLITNYSKKKRKHMSCKIDRMKHIYIYSADSNRSDVGSTSYNTLVNNILPAVMTYQENKLQ